MAVFESSTSGVGELELDEMHLSSTRLGHRRIHLVTADSELGSVAKRKVGSSGREVAILTGRIVKENKVKEK